MLSLDTRDDEPLVLRAEGAQGLLVAGAQFVPEDDVDRTGPIARKVVGDVHEHRSASDPACLVADQIEYRPSQVRLDRLRMPRPEQ
jgi:hypothetical protein